MKNKRMMFGIIVGLIFLLSVGLSYAYFSFEFTTDEGPNDIVAEIGTLRLTYTDGPQITAENIRPGWETTKTVSVENTGSLTAFYSINWLSINNTIERNELVMSSVCTGNDCRVIDEEAVGNVAGPFETGIRIAPETIHTYTLTFKFKETNSAQDYNQGKIFNGVLNIAESVETFTLNGILHNSSNNAISNAQLTLHSDPQTTTTDSKGRFTFENVEVGNHTIEGINGSSIEILDDSISINSGETFNITGTTITKETTSDTINIKIVLGNSNNINSITEIIETSLPTLTSKMNLTSAQSDEEIDFSKTNDGLGQIDTEEFGTYEPNSNGQGLYYTSDLTKTEGGERVYYYRGAVENNYLVFAGYCWRIVRTNEDGSIKIRYGGEPTGTPESYTCPQTGEEFGISNQLESFNQTDEDNTFAGYMMGLNRSGTSTAANAQANTYDSNVKSVIDEWYEENIVTQGNEITSKIANTIYCNDRSVGTPGTVENYTYTSNAYGQNLVLYGPARRLSTGGQNGTLFSTANASPQYKCPNVSRDGFTLSVANGGTTGYGNNALTYPIGLLTPDEVVYAGGSDMTENTTYYLYTGGNYWIMGAFNYIVVVNVYYISNLGELGSYYVDFKHTIVPVISLNSNVLVIDGTGEFDSPYEIE